MVIKLSIGFNYIGVHQIIYRLYTSPITVFKDKLAKLVLLRDAIKFAKIYDLSLCNLGDIYYKGLRIEQL